MTTEIVPDGKSRLRQTTEKLLHPLVGTLAKLHVSPNQVTISGGIAHTLVAASAVAEDLKPAGEKPKPRWLFAAGLVASRFPDLVDGSLARYLQSIGVRHDSEVGQMVDAGTDRATEVAAALLRLHRAHRKNHRFGETAAAAAAITGILPSMARAVAEMRGISVPELDAGSSLSRAALGTLATAYSETQPVSDSLSAVLSVYTAARRLKSHELKKEPLPADHQRAKNRLLLLTGIFSLAVTAVAAYELTNRHSQTKSR